MKIIILKKYFPILFITLCVNFYSCKKDSIYTSPAKPEVVIDFNDKRLNMQLISLVSDTVYVINTNLEVKPTQTLKIAAGTLIKVNPNFSISIQANGKIEAEGNANEPIIFTVNALQGSPGSGIPGTSGAKRLWKGIIINGNFLSNSDNTNSSGILSYVRIEFAGQQRNTDNPVALLLKNVNKQTIINNIQISYSQTSSLIINGGNFNTKNIVSYACNLTDIILENKYQGLMQNILCLKHPYFFSNFDNAGKFENAGLKITQTETLPIISNLTIIGPDNQKGYGVDTFIPLFIAINISNQSNFHICNSVVLGYPSGALKLDNIESYEALKTGESSLSNSFFHSNIADSIFYFDRNIQPPVTSNDLKTYILNPAFENAQYLSSALFKLTNPYDYYETNSPDPSPSAGSPLLKGANFNTAPFTNTFFKKVSYRGALGIGADNWVQGWTNFIPLQTNYNF